VVPVLLPGGVTDAAGAIGYLTVPGGDGLVAVDLETGKVLWQTKDANQALVVDGNRLVARSGRDNRLRVVVLDTTAKGKRLLETEPLELPAWAEVARPWTYQNRSQTFAVGGRIVKGNLELNWSAYKSYFSGAASSAGKKDTASGRARVDLETGKIEVLPAVKVEGPAEKKSFTYYFTLDSGTDFKDFPVEVQALAKKNLWGTGSLVGPRAYGVPYQAGAFERKITDALQAVDIKTGEVLWERPIREWYRQGPPR
jgi:outer membrane protein assembly factor BamB